MKALTKQVRRIALIVLAAGLASALLVRYSPGSLVDERELDPRLSQESLAALRAEREASGSLGAGLARYLKGVVAGDLGHSQSRNAPIASLIVQSAPATLREMGIGLIGAWMLGLGLAIPVGRFRHAWGFDAATALLAGLLLSLPAALVAYLCLTAGAAAETVLVLVLLPRVFRYSRNLLAQAYGSAHVEMARARGVGEWRILGAHVLPSAAPQLAAVGAASVSMAIGATIPIEAICDVAGLGRLAWQAAMARDLPLLVNLTMLIALVTTSAATLSEAAANSRAEAA